MSKLWRNSAFSETHRSIRLVRLRRIAAAKEKTAAARLGAAPIARAERQRQLLTKGAIISSTQRVARRATRTSISTQMRTIMRRLAAKAHITQPKMLTFRIESAGRPIVGAADAKGFRRRPFTTAEGDCIPCRHWQEQAQRRCTRGANNRSRREGIRRARSFRIANCTVDETTFRFRSRRVDWKRHGSLQKFSGSVVKRPFGGGTKSEHDAVMLVTNDGRIHPRRQGGNAFCDPALEKLVGKRVQITGTVTGYTLLITDCFTI